MPWVNYRFQHSKCEDFLPTEDDSYYDCDMSWEYVGAMEARMDYVRRDFINKS